MKKVFALLILLSACIISCKSDTERANEVLANALKLQEPQMPADPDSASETTLLPEQQSIYTSPVLKAPTQEELIKKYRVKTIRQTDGDNLYISNYDKKGNKTSEESDYSGKKLFHYEYDKDGRVTKETVHYKKDGTSYTNIFTYNDEGKLLSRTFQSGKEKSSVTRYEYNKALKRRSEISGSGIDKEFYDDRGLRVRFESYDDKGKLMGYGTAVYNEKGLKTSETGIILGMTSKDEYTAYNEAGQLLEMHRTGIANLYRYYEYDEKGLMTKEKIVGGLAAGETSYGYIFYK